MLTVTIIAKNEEANLRRCLESVRWADEIIVLDSGSTDNTVAIAKEYTDKVYLTDWQGYGVQKQRALTYATGDWVLNIDADESVSETLKKAIQAAIIHNSADAYRIPILLNFYGKQFQYSCCPQNHIRLFRRQGAEYTNNIVHEAVLLPPHARIAKLKAAIHHHSFQDISHALHKINVYSSYSARLRREKKRKPSFIKTIFGAGWMFFRCYIIQLGFLEGQDGLLLAILSAQGSFYRNLKIIYQDKEYQ